MTDLGRQAAFAQEPLAVLRRVHLPRQDLQRNRPLRVLVPGLIDFAHAAFAQEPDNQIVTERLTGGEPLADAVLDGRGTRRSGHGGGVSGVDRETRLQQTGGAQALWRGTGNECRATRCTLGGLGHLTFLRLSARLCLYYRNLHLKLREHSETRRSWKSG